MKWVLRETINGGEQIKKKSTCWTIRGPDIYCGVNILVQLCIIAYKKNTNLTQAASYINECTFM
jgi:hypothetical protein